MPRKKKTKTDKKKKGIKEEIQKKEETTEIFEIDKNGQEKTIETKSTEIINEKPSENQIKEENKIFRNIIIIIGILIIALVTGYLVLKNINNFEYKGINFEVVKEIAPYKTSLPVNYQGRKTEYNFYLRNDPRELENISFDGEINFKKFMVINATDNLNCDGDGIIAIANLANLYKVLGAQVIKDQNATCDSEGNFMYLNLIEGDESKIEQNGISCYQLVVNNCEVLEVTEKFMIESLAKVEELS